MKSTERDILLAATGGGLKVAGSILSILGGIGVGVLLTRFLGAVGFGQYRLGVITAEILAQIGALGVPSAALLFIPIALRRAEWARAAAIFRLACVVPVLMGSALGAAVFIFAEEISIRIFQDPGFAPTLQIFSFAIPLHGLLNSLEMLARAFNRVDIAVAGRDICFQGSKIVLTAAALFAGYAIGGAAVAHFAASAISVVLLFLLTRQLLPRRGEMQSAGLIPEGIWNQAVPLYLARLPLALGGQIETLVLGFFGLTSGVGIYAAALQLSRVGEIFPLSLISVVLPLISGAYDRGGAAQVQPILQITTRWAITVTLPFFVVTALFAEPLLLIFGEEFSAGRNGLILLASIPVLRSISGLSAAVSSMTGHARINSVNSLAYLGLALLLDVLLIPMYGVLGAAIAAFTAMSILSALRLAEVFWMLRISPFERSIFKPILSAIVAGVIGLVASELVASWSVVAGAVVGIAATGAAYIAIVLALGLSEEDLRIIDHVWMRFRRRKSGES